MRTFTCRSTFLYNLGHNIGDRKTLRFHKLGLVAVESSFKNVKNSLLEIKLNAAFGHSIRRLLY
jgi:hypothetical protein